MNPELVTALEQLLTDTTGEPGKIAGRSGVGGGCISSAELVELTDGRSYFVKHNAAPLDGMFERECEGLRALADVGAVRVPVPLGCGGKAGSRVPPFIVMEAIREGRPGVDFQARFGRQLAELHRSSRSRRFGFDEDNYLGSTPQPNGWMDDWCDFWRTHRLGFQIRLARRQGVGDDELQSLGDRLLERLDDYLATPDEPACLLHGDLWGGNYLTDENGEPVLIDPATYYGRREADLAMTMLFGGFSPDFYRAYEEVWPLEEGSRERLEIYKLYHLLNHLNLFGASYRGQCVAILRRLV